MITELSREKQTNNGTKRIKSLFEFESELRDHMISNGIPYNGQFKHNEGLQRFSRDSKKQPDEWYISFSGTSPRGNNYLNCTYGSWEDGEKFTYNSFEIDETLSQEEKSIN